MALILPNSELQDIIRRANNEDVNTRDASMQAVTEWLAKQPHLPDTWADSYILAFLRGCSFSIEKTKRKLDLYLTMRAAVPEFFANRNIKRPELQEAAKQITLPPLPTMTPDGNRVMVCRVKEKCEHQFLFSETSMKINLMIGEVRTIEETFGNAGEVYIFDADTFTPAHIKQINLGLVKKYLICVQESCPIKLKEVHVINAHSLVSVLYDWFKPFLKEKIRNRVYFHSNGLESLYKFVPKDILPDEYGGAAGKLQDLHDAWMKKLEEYIPWFQEDENIKADESKRPGKSMNYDELFGVAGSFKRLAVD